MSDEFEWDEANIMHIARHGVSPEEFEQVFDNTTYEIDYDFVRGE